MSSLYTGIYGCVFISIVYRNLVCSESELNKILDRCNKEESIEDHQPLYIDHEMEVILCKWCPTWKGSQQPKVINQHTKTSKSHQTARQKAFGITTTDTRDVQDIRKYFLPSCNS